MGPGHARVRTPFLLGPAERIWLPGSRRHGLGTPQEERGGTHMAFSRTDGTSSPENQPRREGASASARHVGPGLSRRRGERPHLPRARVGRKHRA